MDQQNAQCSHDIEEQETSQNQSDNAETESIMSKEIFTNALDLSFELNTPKPFTIASPLSYNNNESHTKMNCQASVPLVIINRPSSLVMGTRTLTQQPQMPSNLPSPTSLISGQPQSLFLQALTKLNEKSLSNAVTNHYRTIQIITDESGRKIVKKIKISTPDSLVSAPPSYSFVLRQMAVRRRPRIVGTFIPSPSFVQHTPPPNYTAAFDIYVDTPMPPAQRVYNFGFTSMPVVCPDCGYTGMSIVTSKITLCTHLCAVILCILCCWVCAPLPYVLKSCKDVYHYCRNCRTFLGMYCPTTPDSTLN